MFHSGALGDFVLTWPLLLGVARVLPQSRTMVITAGEKARLAEHVLRVEGRDVDSGWSPLFGEGKVGEKQAKALAAAGLIVSFVSDGTDAWANNVKRLAPEASCLFLEPPPRDLKGRHASEHLLEQLRPHELLRGAAEGMLKSLTTTGLMPRLRDKDGPIVLHPGSGGTAKNWPIGDWINLASALRSGGCEVRVLLGEVERERLGETDIAGLAEHGEIVRPQTLLDLLDALRGTAGFVGHDSGPVHLAGICGLPATAIFVSSRPEAWHPLGPATAAVEAKTFDQTIAAVIRDLMTR